MEMFVGESDEDSSKEIAELILRDGKGVFETTSVLMLDAKTHFERLFIFLEYLYIYY